MYYIIGIVVAVIYYLKCLKNIAKDNQETAWLLHPLKDVYKPDDGAKMLIAALMGIIAWLVWPLALVVIGSLWYVEKYKGKK